MTTIPANQLVNIVPSVISAGGQELDIIGLVLTQNTRAPIGSVLSFPNSASVSSFFGPTSREATIGSVYFEGFTGSDALPLAILFAQFNTAAVSAYLRGGNISAIPLATLQGYNGTLSVTIDGVLKSANINLAAATSFSNGAEIIGNGLGITGVVAGQFTGSIGGTTLNVTSIVSGLVLAAGDVVGGTVGSLVAGTYIITQLTGSAGGIGTYQVSSSQTVPTSPLTASLPGVTYDSVSGAFVVSSGTTGSGSTIGFGSGALAASLLLTQALGAVTWDPLESTCRHASLSIL